MKRANLLFLTLVLGLVLWTQLPARLEQQMESVMGARLVHAHALLDGIALKDFDLVADSADRLVAMSEAAGWENRLGSREYTHFSNQFRLSAELLARAARDRNYDEATFSYTELSMACFDCHKHVREVTRAGIRPARPFSWTRE